MNNDNDLMVLPRGVYRRYVTDARGHVRLCYDVTVTRNLVRHSKRWYVRGQDESEARTAAIRQAHEWSRLPRFNPHPARPIVSASAPVRVKGIRMIKHRAIIQVERSFNLAKGVRKHLYLHYPYYPDPAQGMSFDQAMEAATTGAKVLYDLTHEQMRSGWLARRRMTPYVPSMADALESMGITHTQVGFEDLCQMSHAFDPR